MTSTKLATEYILSEKITQVSFLSLLIQTFNLHTIQLAKEEKEKKRETEKKYLSLFFVGLLFSEMRQFQIRTGLEEHEHTLCEKHSLFPGLFSSLFTLCYINLDCLLKNAFPFLCFAYFKDKSGVRNKYV